MTVDGCYGKELPRFALAASWSFYEGSDPSPLDHRLVVDTNGGLVSAIAYGGSGVGVVELGFTATVAVKLAAALVSAAGRVASSDYGVRQVPEGTEVVDLDEAAAEAGAVSFYWIDGNDEGYREYHWDSSCPWLRVPWWHGASVLTAAVPPRSAADFGYVRRRLSMLGVVLEDRAWTFREPGARRWLCTACRHAYDPRDPHLEPEAEPCAVCRHSIRVHGGPGSGCETGVYDEDAGGVPCPCNQYVRSGRGARRGTCP
jgi:hypothetical protein